MDMEKQRKCQACGETKAITLFSFKKTSKGGGALREMCKACERRIHGKAKHKTR